MRESNPELHRGRVSASLRGKIGPLARRWKGDNASYVAKHMWIYKYYGKAAKCEIDLSHKAKRFEWSNVSGEYLRTRSDYRQLCPSCHRKIDKGNYCKNGHEYSPQNTYIRKEGWRMCKTCRTEAHRRFKCKE